MDRVCVLLVCFGLAGPTEEWYLLSFAGSRLSESRLRAFDPLDKEDDAMSFYDAFAAADPAIHWKGELGARIRDILNRRATDLGVRVEALARLVERGIDHSLSVERIKGSLSSLLAALKRRRSASSADQAEVEELTLLFERVVLHGEGREIESYTAFLFTVDTDVRF
jgi:hypothetical protein